MCIMIPDTAHEWTAAYESHRLTVGVGAVVGWTPWALETYLRTGFVMEGGVGTLVPVGRCHWLVGVIQRLAGKDTGCLGISRSPACSLDQEGCPAS